MVELLSGYGLPQEHICTLVTKPDGKPIDLKTLHKRFRTELDRGIAKALSAVAQTLHQSAVGAPAVYDDKGRMLRDEVKPDKTAQIFIAKARLGFKERSVQEQTGEGGGPVKHVLAIFPPGALEGLDEDELALLEKVEKKMLGDAD